MFDIHEIHEIKAKLEIKRNQLAKARDDTTCEGVCPLCGGRGLYKQPVYHNEYDVVICHRCNGTGSTTEPRPNKTLHDRLHRIKQRLRVIDHREKIAKELKKLDNQIGKWKVE